MSQARGTRALLHSRVKAFIAASVAGGPHSESFEQLALDIAAYQAEHVAAYRRLLDANGTDPLRAASVRDLPAVPTDVFRLTRVAAHLPADDAVVFRTSGTTGGVRGEHSFATTKTYETAALAWGDWALFFDAPPRLRAVVLGPPPSDPASGDSSLQFMMRLFTARWAKETRFLQLPEGSASAIDAGALGDACARAERAAEPAIVMGTSFAFVHALDALAGARFELPPGSRAMHTGGFKGRSREVLPEVLRADIASTFGIEANAVVGEYGMTELSSQLYEGTLRGARGLVTPSARHGLFVPPPWLRVVAVDPETLAPLADGNAGILRFEDLANVDSALVVQTADRGVCGAFGVELLGRAPGAPPRGCSLAIEELLS